MWRPDNWENPYFLRDIDGGYYNKYPEFEVFETGADAMLEALSKLKMIEIVRIIDEIRVKSLKG